MLVQYAQTLPDTISLFQALRPARIESPRSVLEIVFILLAPRSPAELQPHLPHDHFQLNRSYCGSYSTQHSPAGPLIPTWWSSTRPPIILAPLIKAAAPLILVLPPQRLQPLLLRMRIDVRPDHKPDEVEERHPRLVGQECLRKGEGEWGGDPGDLHDGHEACADGGADLMEGAGAGDDGHAG